MEYYIDPVVFIVGKTGGENRAVRNLLDLFAEGATIPFIAPPWPAGTVQSPWDSP